MADGIYCYIDWDGDGVWTSSSEDVSAYLRSYNVKRGKDSNMGRAMVGTAQLTLKDVAGKFIPSSTVSALTGYVLPGRKVKIMRTYGDVDYTLFVGYLDDIQNDYSETVREAYFACTDGSEKLAATELKTSPGAIFYEDQDSDYGIARVLWYCGLNDQNLDDGDYLYHYVWPYRITAKTAIQRYEDAENGFFYVARAGTYSWETQDHRATYHSTSEWTCPGTVWRSLKTQNNRKNVINEVVMKTIPKYENESTGAVLWECLENIEGNNARAIADGGTEFFWVDYKDANGNQNVATSVTTWGSTSTFLVSSSSLGGGINRTAGFSFAFEFTDWDSAYVSVYDDGSTGGGYITVFKLLGSIWTDFPEVKVESESTSSQDIYGLQSKTYDLAWAPSSSDMQTIANNVVANNSSSRPTYIVEIVPNSSDALTHALDLDISDRFTLQDSRISLSRDVYIDQVQHNWSVMDGVHHTHWTVSCAT